MHPAPHPRHQLLDLYRGRHPRCPFGHLDKERILAELADQDKADLLAWLDLCLITMDHFQLDTIFGELARERLVRPLSAEAVLAAVRRFREDSLAGKYYAPFDITSKNYDHIPPATEAWFGEIAVWLDRVCELAQAGEKDAALAGFTLLFELIELLPYKDIVFGRHDGEWMIRTRGDYRTVYRELTEEQDCK